MHDRDEASEILSGKSGVALPALSVVVPFKKSEYCILDCLRSIFGMNYPKDRLDVIVVDDWHDDEVAATVRERFPAARLMRNSSPQGCDLSKQAGIDVATGEIIAHTDADCTVDPLWGRVIAKNLSDGARIVTGPVKHPMTLLREAIGISDFPDYQGEEHRWIAGFPGCNFAARRDVFEQVRYCKSSDSQGGSDRLTSWRLHTSGYRIHFDPAMAAYHAPAVDILNLLQRRLRYGSHALALRRIDPTLPGGLMARLGPLAAPGYMCYKMAKDVCKLFGMGWRRQVNPWHIPLLFPVLLLFRLVDAAGIAFVQLCDGGDTRPRRRFGS